MVLFPPVSSSTMMSGGRSLVAVPGSSILSRLSLMTAGILSCCGFPMPICEAGLAFVAKSTLQSFPDSTTRTYQTRSRVNIKSASKIDMDDEDEAGTAVNDESWYLGDGGFAKRYLNNEERISSLKRDKEFFRERSLSVYDQMREASMLLLAQQQVLAAEEAREQASRPKFLPAESEKVVRERQRQRDAASGLPETPPLPKTSEVTQDWTADGLLLAIAPGMLSGRTLGIGGLDEELEEIRRRVCLPLAAPAELLQDLGITPVRGLLLHGPPGCGKSLLAKRISAVLTRRPPTVVSGPEVLERFVGSSEANVRALFDFPPDVPGGTDYHQANELHVIVLDEFDSIGQKRGGGDDGGDRVRDSVVNQLLARMDGFQELERPTLLVALTNRIDLLDKALLRPGRFEVQVEIPGPDMEGREAILRIHTKRMHEAGRIALVPSDDASGDVDGYDSLMSSLASVTEGFTGAELAGLVRAAASYALERTVSGMVDAAAGEGVERKGEIAVECHLTAEDFGHGLADVLRAKVPEEGEGARERASAGAASASSAAAANVGATMTVTGVKVGDTGSKDGSRGDVRTTAGGVEWGEGSKSAIAAAAAVASVRSENQIRGGLSEEDLEAVQELLRRKTGERQAEESLLVDAAKVVSQRRRKRQADSGEDHAGNTDDDDEEQGGLQCRGGDGDAEASPSRSPRLRKFEHTGWFHTYE